MSRVTKFLASLAAAALVVTGLTAMPANASGNVTPYVISTLASYQDRAVELVPGNGRVFYKVGGKLYTSDGTTQTMLADFGDITSVSLAQTNPQSTVYSGSYATGEDYVSHSVLIGTKLYFWGFSAGSWSIWVTDGTVAGTRSLVTAAQVWVGSPSDNVLPNLFAAGNNIFFWSGIASASANASIWKVDTSASTPIAVNVSPNSLKSTCVSADARTMQSFAVLPGNSDRLVFDYTTTDNGTCVNALGVINVSATSSANANGSRLGTPSSHSLTSLRLAHPQKLTLFKNKIYFYAYANSNFLAELWATNGTEVGTTAVLPLSGTFDGVNPSGYPSVNPTVVGDMMYFSGWPSGEDEAIYQTDGTTFSVLKHGADLWRAGEHTSGVAAVVGTAPAQRLIIDGITGNNPAHNVEMYSIVLAGGLTTKLIETADSYWGGIGCGLGCSAGSLNSSSETATWDGKAWWVATSTIDNDGGIPLVREIYYSDGTAAGTAKATDMETEFGTSSNTGQYTIGYQGGDPQSGNSQTQAPRDVWATKPIVVANDRVFFLSGSGPNNSTWTLRSIVRNVPPTPPLTCAAEITKLKVEADSATDLSPAFNKNTCNYTMGVDSKTSKVDFTPTFTGTLAMKVGGTSVATANLPKTTKTYSATLGAAGTSTAVDFIFGSDTYRVTITRAAAAVPGARDPGFTAPSLPNGSVKTVDKDEKKEVNQNGDKKDAEVTIVGGTFDGKVAKLDDNGKKDETFSANVPPITGTVNVVKVDEQHRVVVAGQNVDGDKDVIRLKPDGSKDNSFVGPDLGPGKKVDDVEVQKDGKIVVAGDFGDNKNVTKLKTDGSEDQTFKANLPTIPGEVKTAKVQDDGKILLGGSFENAGGDNDKDKIIRVDKDGHIDNNFVPATNAADPTKKAHFNDDVEDIEVQQNGKIVVVGKSNKTSDDEADKVVRLNKDGKEDSTFVFDGVIPSDKEVEALKVKDTGEIYIAGNFDNVGDNDGDKIAKVKKDGHVDTDWNPPTQGGDVHDIELEKHGKVFLGGDGSGDGDKVDKVEEDGDRSTDKPRYDSIDDERSTNNTPTGTKGRTTIHGDGFTPDTIVTIGGKPANFVSVDDRGEDLVVQVPSTRSGDPGYATGSDPKPVDVVITVPGKDPIEVPEAFEYVATPEPQVIKPEGDHFDSDKDDADHKGKVNDDEAISGYIPSGEPVVAISTTPAICTVDDENRVEYLTRGDCKIVVDAPATLGYSDPAPVTEVIPVAGLDPALVAPTLPTFDPQVPSLPEVGYDLPDPGLVDPTIPVVYTPTTPDACEVNADGIVAPIDSSLDCTISISSPGTTIYEPAPAVTVNIPHTAWITPVPVDHVIQDPQVTATGSRTGGTTKVGTDFSWTFDAAKGRLIPTSSGIYTGPIKATVTYTWTKSNNTTGTGTCLVSWGVLKKWSALSKADQKKYVGPRAQKKFTTTNFCQLNPAAKTAIKQGGTLVANATVVRTRMWPTTYKAKVGDRGTGPTILPRSRHYVLTLQ